jgi:hypothetical protein
MDPNVYGYLILTLRRSERGKTGKVRFAAQINNATWPIFRRTMRRIVKAGHDVYSS